jgi:hypothetical protein
VYIDLEVGRDVSIVVAVTVVVGLLEGNCLVICVERRGSEDVYLVEITGVLLLAVVDCIVVVLEM